jgi:hypothetical protein
MVCIHGCQRLVCWRLGPQPVELLEVAEILEGQA